MLFAVCCRCWWPLQALAAAREEEFERWKGHLEGVEVALQAAQQESLTYRWGLHSLADIQVQQFGCSCMHM
jgi:hypothetical protein